jgi:hypothetical protein
LTVGVPGRGIYSVLFLWIIPMVPSSSIIVTVNGQRLTCGGFSLTEPVHLGNFEFITNYFDSLSLSPKRGNEGTVIVGSTRSGASTPHRATIEDSTEESLMASSKEGSFSHLSPRWCSTGGSFAPTAVTWKESAPTTMGFPPRTAAPWPKTNHPSEQRHARDEGKLAQAHARRPPAELEPAPRRCSLTNR